MQTAIRGAYVRILRFGRAEEGAVMAEFVVVAPIFLFLIFGIVQFMGISHADAVLQYANFMAARTGAVHYEAYSHGWDPASKNGNWVDRLEEKMTHGAASALGPFYEDKGLVAQVINPGDLPGTGFLYTPVRFEQDSVKVHAGIIGDSQSKNFPFWITSETDGNLELALPWVGRVIQLIGAVGPREPRDRGVDPFQFEEEATVAYSTGGLPFLSLRSDNYLDTRTGDRAAGTIEPRAIPWPLSIGNGYSGLHGGFVHLQGEDPQPVALPIQSRRPNGLAKP